MGAINLEFSLTAVTCHLLLQWKMTEGGLPGDSVAEKYLLAAPNTEQNAGAAGIQYRRLQYCTGIA